MLISTIGYINGNSIRFHKTDFSQIISFSNGTNSTSTSTGSIVVTGGVGVSGSIYLGNQFSVNTGTIASGFRIHSTSGGVSNLALDIDSSSTSNLATSVIRLKNLSNTNNNRVAIVATNTADATAAALEFQYDNQNSAGTQSGSYNLYTLSSGSTLQSHRIAAVGSHVFGPSSYLGTNGYHQMYGSLVASRASGSDHLNAGGIEGSRIGANVFSDGTTKAISTTTGITNVVINRAATLATTVYSLDVNTTAQTANTAIAGSTASVQSILANGQHTFGTSSGSEAISHVVNGSVAMTTAITGFDGTTNNRRYIGNNFQSILWSNLSGGAATSIIMYAGGYNDGTTNKRSNANLSASRLNIVSTNALGNGSFLFQTDPSLSHAADSTASFVNTGSITTEGTWTIGPSGFTGTHAVIGNATVSGTLVNTGLVTATAGIKVATTSNADTTLTAYYHDDTLSSVTFRQSGAPAGSVASSAVAIKITRVGRLVTIYVPGFTSTTGTASAATPVVGSSAIPAWARPLENVIFTPHNYIDNGAAQVGKFQNVEVNASSGNLSYYLDLGATAYTAGAPTQTIRAHTITYVI